MKRNEIIDGLAGLIALLFCVGSAVLVGVLTAKAGLVVIATVHLAAAIGALVTLWAIYVRGDYP